MTKYQKFMLLGIIGALALLYAAYKEQSIVIFAMAAFVIAILIHEFNQRDLS
ncbi:MAG TPA: hypothetical protein VES38_06610 [Methylotenera sp.]|nr:hypothetical protein [Methylotenera sp.]